MKSNMCIHANLSEITVGESGFNYLLVKPHPGHLRDLGDRFSGSIFFNSSKHS